MVHGIRLITCVSLSLCHFLLIHLVFNPGTFPSGNKCLADKLALKRGKSEFQSQNSVLHKARSGKCVESIHIAKVLGRHSSIIVLKAQVVWGWDALSSTLFLDRYFPPIIFGQKQEKKNMWAIFFCQAEHCQLGLCWFKYSSLVTFVSPCPWDVKDAVDTSKGSSSLSSYPRHHFNTACLMLHISVSPTKWQWKLLHSSAKGNGAEWKPQ